MVLSEVQVLNSLLRCQLFIDGAYLVVGQIDSNELIAFPPALVLIWMFVVEKITEFFGNFGQAAILNKKHSRLLCPLESIFKALFADSTPTVMG